MKRIAFIINPISGNKRLQEIKRTLPELVKTLLDARQWSATISYTAYASHATELAQQYAREGYEAVVACGGDGTVNEVACGLRDTSTAMGILPMGSGNGLARHLHIPMDLHKAIELLNHAHPASIDYGLANNRLFVCCCGAGLDAEVAERFAGCKQRGFLTYIFSTVRLLFTYRPQTYQLLGDKINHTQRAFLITFANANQWGNNALIAPRADVSDGLLDIAIMSPYALWGSPGLAIRLFAGTIDRSPLMTMLRTQELTLRREHAAPFHLDGDPVTMPEEIQIRLVHQGLRVITTASI